MRKVKIKAETDKTNWSLPDQNHTAEDLIASIKLAEEGPFYSVEESKSDFEKWLNQEKSCKGFYPIQLRYQKHFEYGELTFGYNAAKIFISEIYYHIENLDTMYLFHPEYRYLPTKSQIYRNIILGSDLIIYRIAGDQIEVLKAISSKMSITKIKGARSIKI